VRNSPVPTPQDQPCAPASGSADAQVAKWAAEHLVVLYRVAYRLVGNCHDAEDVVQDTFRSAWVSRHLYDPARSERSWLLAILRRRASDSWRRRDGRQSMLGEAAADIVGSHDADPFAAELSSAVQRALARLPDEIRETLLLVVVGELTHQEAADLLEVPLGTVLSRVSRGRSRMREFLIESGLREGARGG